ncbi:MAG TPA: hypothetical protein VMZ28_13255 [Kofleriaceae bacterium]|nr:hypothetical protein [Kofleriaceae bacterium]
MNSGVATIASTLACGSAELNSVALGLCPRMFDDSRVAQRWRNSTVVCAKTACGISTRAATSKPSALRVIVRRLSEFPAVHRPCRDGEDRRSPRDEPPKGAFPDGKTATERDRGQLSMAPENGEARHVSNPRLGRALPNLSRASRRSPPLSPVARRVEERIAMRRLGLLMMATFWAGCLGEYDPSQSPITDEPAAEDLEPADREPRDLLGRGIYDLSRPDAGVADQGMDLSAGSDLAAAADLRAASDLGTVSDLRTTDLTTAPVDLAGRDLAGADLKPVVADLSTSPDLKPLADLSSPPDLTTAPDLAPACDKAVATINDGHHFAGADCGNCHLNGPNPPKWTVSGTVYDSAGGANAIAGATITVTDANGQVLKLITALNGNFWTATPVVPPLKVKASRCPNIQNMVAPASEGHCNGCHGPGARIHLP